MFATVIHRNRCPADKLATVVVHPYIQIKYTSLAQRGDPREPETHSPQTNLKVPTVLIIAQYNGWKITVSCRQKSLKRNMLQPPSKLLMTAG